jgi:hypothetical protein
LKLSSVPQGAGLDWSDSKVTFGHPESTEGESNQGNPDAAQRSETDPADTGVMQGVVWTLPAKMFTELGGRLTGSLAVTFIPCELQMGAQPASGEPTFQPRAILAHAVVYPKGVDPCWVPAERRFIRLHVAPQPPNPTAGSSGT